MESPLDAKNDCFLDLKRLSEKSCISVRTLRDLLKGPNPLPAFQLKGKILVSWHEFSQWLEQYRIRPELQDKIDGILRDLRS